MSSNRTAPRFVYAAMPGMLIVAFFATLIILRATRASGACVTGGIVLIGFGIWLVWTSVVGHPHGMSLEGPHAFTLMLGIWLVVKGALRASSD
jgi:hypothetical protein